jgi:hypothetical protein
MISIRIIGSGSIEGRPISTHHDISSRSFAVLHNADFADNLAGPHRFQEVDSGPAGLP